MNNQNNYAKKNVAIVGLGYVGCPLAYLTALKGFNVYGIDTNIDVINNINNKKDIPKFIENYLINCNKFFLTASNNYSLISKTEIVVVCIPTPTKNKKPNLSILKIVINKIGMYLKKGTLLIIESTLAPGMTKQYVQDELLETFSLKINIDYYLAYCPERIDPGNNKYWVGNINRVCGASSRIALEMAFSFYKKILDSNIVLLNSIEEAEMVKVWENSTRNMLIAQANLLAIACDKYNFSFENIMDGLNSKIDQFGLNLLNPGLGPGGHCIPEDIHYLIDSMNKKNIDTSLFKKSVKINEYMPYYAYKKIYEFVKNDKRSFSEMKILMLGAAYKTNSSDCRCSTAIKLYNILIKKSKNVKILDPYVDSLNIKNFNKVLKHELLNCDIVILSCAHDLFIKINFLEYKNIKYILDCWNKLNKNLYLNSSIKYIGIGK